MKTEATPKMDWQQVALNGGPPCFAVLDDEGGWYCGRAERWEGHDGDHKFVSLESLIANARASDSPAVTAWPKGWPQIEGFYWRRIDATDIPTLVAARSDGIRFTDGSREGVHECYEFLGPISPSDMEQVVRLGEEREMLIYWLLRAYQSGHREGWEEGPSSANTVYGLLHVLSNLGLDPNLSPEAEAILKRKPVFFVGATGTWEDEPEPVIRAALSGVEEKP